MIQRRHDTLTGRWLRSDAPPQVGIVKPPAKPCPECGLPIHAKGLCKLHYEARRRLAEGRKPQVPGAKCSKCGAPHMAMGLCGRHYDEEKNRSLPVSFRHFRSHAKSSGRTVSLTFEQFSALVVQPCYYCGDGPSVEQGRGLDRVDSGRDYDADNVVPCCWTCNFMKRHLSVAAWMAHMRKVLKRLDEQ